MRPKTVLPFLFGWTLGVQPEIRFGVQRRSGTVRTRVCARGTWDEALLSAELNDLLTEDFDLSLIALPDGELDKLLACLPEGDVAESGAGHHSRTAA